MEDWLFRLGDQECHRLIASATERRHERAGNRPRGDGEWVPFEHKQQGLQPPGPTFEISKWLANLLGKTDVLADLGFWAYHASNDDRFYINKDICTSGIKKVKCSDFTRCRSQDLLKQGSELVIADKVALEMLKANQAP